MDAESAARLTDGECFDLIFAPGFSTKKEISDVSGRGVGMDVVKTRINQLNGTIQIDSSIGKGTVISIQLPLTLAIVPTLMVVVGTQAFALPLNSVQEIIDLNSSAIHNVDGNQAIRVRGKTMPLYYLRNWLVTGYSELPSDHGHVVIVRVGSQLIALLVDRLTGQEEVVVKPLGKFCKRRRTDLLVRR